MRREADMPRPVLRPQALNPAPPLVRRAAACPVLLVAALAALALPAPERACAQAPAPSDALAAPEHEIEIVDGVVVVKPAGGKKAPKPAQAATGAAQVLELIDNSQLRGRLISLGAAELVWQRSDSTERLSFSTRGIRRIILGGAPPAGEPTANATLKLRGGGWIAGNLSGFENGKLQLQFGATTGIGVAREKIDWLYLSPSSLVDACDSPAGPLGLAGWDTSGFRSDAWKAGDRGISTKSATRIVRRFDFLPEKLDLGFTAGDAAQPIRNFTIRLQPGGPTAGFANVKGTVHLHFQATVVSGSFFDGQNMKSFSATFQEPEDAPKPPVFRALIDQRAGRVVVLVNGRKIADWAPPLSADFAAGGSMAMWWPNFANPESAWTLSKMHVRPWDGTLEPDPKPAEAGKDLLSTGAAGRISGTLENVTADSILFEGKEVARKEPLFVRLAGGGPSAPAAPAAARVRLSQRGEFDVGGISVQDGKLKVATAFAGEIALPLGVVGAIEFPNQLTAEEILAAEGGDTLIFTDGDELRGTLVSVGKDQALKWKPTRGGQTMGLGIASLAGVALGKRHAGGAQAGSAAVRFRDGDWLTGELQSLDGDRLRMASPIAANLTIPRPAVRALYFGSGQETPVWDGATGSEIWMGLKGPGAANQSAWRYFDGTFSFIRGASPWNRGGSLNLVRTFDGLPEKVELSFDLSTSGGPAGYSVQFFSEENQAGLMVQGNWDNAYIYDNAPRTKGGAFFNRPQQVQFGGEILADSNRRSLRFLVDRRTAQLAMFVNGRLLARFSRKPGKEAAKLGNRISVVPQLMNSNIAVSNLWVSPWAGAMPPAPQPKPPGENANPPDGNDGKPAEPESPNTDIVGLVNGDEAPGTVENMTADMIRLNSDGDELDIPRKRAFMLGFAGAPAPPVPGMRLRLAGKGAITIQSFQLADGSVTCHNGVLGKLQFPLTAISEIVFRPRREPALGGATPPAPVVAADIPENGNPGGLTIRGNGTVLLNGGRIQLNGGALQLNGANIPMKGTIELNGGNVEIRNGNVELKGGAVITR